MTRFKIIIILYLAVAMLLPVYSIAQYFNIVHDCQMTYDWGRNVYLNTDNSYTVIGNNADTISTAMYMDISADGKQLLDCKRTFMAPANCYLGYSGRAKRLPNGYFFVPMTISWPNGFNDPWTGIGMMLLNKNGDTVFTRSYTDTSKNWEETYDGIIMPDGGYLLAGYTQLKGLGISFANGILRRTDSAGNLLWTKNYSGYNAKINSIQLLTDGNILIGGAGQIELVWVGPGDFYYRHKPYFALADSSNGNIIKDTIIDQGYVGGGYIVKDANGGYYHVGKIDKLYAGGGADHPYSFADYVTHLDNNFRTIWQSDIVVNQAIGRRSIAMIKQLKDSNYLLIGSHLKNIVMGWAAKMDTKGYFIWEHTYVIDSSTDGYLTDGIERPDGGFTFTGSARDSATPQSQRYDVWLLSVDKNGCLVPGCNPNSVEEIKYSAYNMRIYPNPVTSNLQIELPQDIQRADVFLTDITGKLILQKEIKQGKNTVDMSSLATGMYFIKIADERGMIRTEKVVKE